MVTAAPLNAASLFWDAGGADTNWSTLANWAGDVSPAGKEIYFNNTGAAGTAGTVTSIVTTSLTAQSLYFQNTGSNFHTLQINSGAVLTLDGTASAAPVFQLGTNTAAANTSVAITGAGSLLIQGRATGKDFILQNTDTTGANSTQTLDMTGLASFVADVDQFLVGFGTGKMNFNLTLADSTSITANAMIIGDNTTPTPTGVLKLGQTNVFNSNTIVLGAGRDFVTASFRSGLTGTPTLKIRGTGGTDADLADLVIGVNASVYGAFAGGSSLTNNVLDTTAGSVDFRLDELVLGIGGSIASDALGIGNGTFIFDEGSVTANSITIARVTDAASGTAGDRGASPNGTLDMRGGTLNATTLTIGLNQDGSTGMQAAIRGRALISGGTATITGDVVLGIHTAASASTGAAEGTLTLSGGTLSIGGNLTLGQDGGNNAAIVTLSGGTLDMNGGSIIGITTLNLQSGVLKNVAEINSGAGLVKTTGGILILDGVNTYTGGTVVSAGTLQLGSGASSGNLGAGTVTVQSGAYLSINRDDRMEISQNITGAGSLQQIGPGKTVLSGSNDFTGATFVNSGTLQVASATGLQNTSSLTVQSGSTFSYRPGVASTLTIAATSGTALFLSGGSTLEVELGGTIALKSGATAFTSGTIALNLIGNPLQNPSSGTYTLLSSPSGGLNGGTYDFNVFNATNFSATLNAVTANGVSVNVTAVPGGLTSAYWRGGQVAGAGGVWAQSGATTSNWASDAAGTATALVPGATTNVFLSVTSGATQQTAMTLGVAMTIRSLTIQDSSATTLNGDLNTLTIGGSSAITVSSGAGLATLDARLFLADSSPLVNVSNASGLILSGELAGNALIKTGSGDLTLSGTSTNTYTGDITVNEGALLLGKTGVNTIIQGLIIGDATGTDTVRLLAADQISDTSDVLINSSGVLDLNDHDETIDALNGSGLVTNSGTGTATLTVGAGDDTTASYSGVIQNGGGTLSLVKTGAGVQVLSGANTHTGLTLVSSGTLRLGASDVLVGAVTVSGATAVFDLGTGHTDTVGQVTLINGGTITGGAGAVLSSTANFDLQNGTLAGTLGGATELVKTTTATLTITAAQAYTGATRVIEGAVVLGAGGSLPATSLIVGDGANATFTAAAGSTFSVGSGSSDVLYVGNRIAVTTLGASDSTLDLSALSTATVNVGNLYVGYNLGNGNGGLTRGTVLWATSNTITASGSIVLGSTKSNGNAGTSIMTFGSGMNIVNTPRFVIGGEKSNATVTIGSGGTLVLGSSSAPTDLILGYNAGIGTGSTSTGTLNLTGGTFIAQLGTFEIGDKNGGGTNGAGVGTFTSGTSADNSVHATTLIIGDLSGGTAAGARGTGTLIWNGGLLQADSVLLGRFGSGLGLAQGTLTLNGGLVQVGSDITDAGGANSTTTVTLNGATLDMQGHAIGSAASMIDTLSFQSGTLRNVSEINGGAALVKSGSGTLVLSGTNSYTGVTNVTGGTLWAQSAGAMGATSSVSVSSGATFNYSPGAGEVLNLSSLTLANGSRIGAEVKNGSIVVSGAASTAGTITVNLFGIAGQTLTTGRYNLVTAASGLNGASYTLGNLYNVTNFTVSSVGGDAGSIYVNLTAVSALTSAYWKGGFSGAANVWAVTNGTSASNWTTDAAGLNGTGLVPGTTTDVIFSATGATNQGAMVLGANMSIGSLTFNDSSSVTLNDVASSLTLNKAAAITVNSGAVAIKLATRLSFADAAAVVNVDAGSSGLELGGRLTGVNGFNKTGLGTLSITGADATTLSGTITVSAGLLELAKNTGVDAVSGDLIIGDGSGTDTVRLIHADQISDSSTVTLNSSGVLDLNGLDESMGALGGSGLVTSSTAGNVTLTLGAGGTSASFAGTIENGAGTLSLVKTGSGTQTLAVPQTYTGLTTVSAGTLALGASNVLTGDLLVSGATAVFDLGTGHTDTLNHVTLQNGGTLNGGAGSLLSSSTDFDFQSGTVNVSLGGSAGILKTTSGTVTVNSTASTFTGNVLITGGTFAIGADDALPTGAVVILGAGTQTGTLDLTNASQTLDSLLVQSSTSAVNHVIIGSGQTLTLNGGGLQLGLANTVGIDSRATFSGGGNLVIATPGQNLQAGFPTSPAGAAPNNNTDVDLSGLGSFTADVNQFSAGYGSNVASDVILSDTANTITANTIEVGNSAGINGYTGTLQLGAGTNILQANTLDVGLSKVRGIMKFASSAPGSSGTLVLTGRNGGEIDINVGSTAGTGTAATPYGTLDLRGHDAQVRADAVVIGRRDGTLGGGAQGEIFFDSGSFAANSISMAAKINAGTGTATALLQIGGGSFVVGTGGFTLASQSGTAGTAVGTLTITGGKVISSSSILDGGGAATTTLTLNGGTLDLQGNTIGNATNLIDNLSFQSGVLRNVAEINGGAGLVKTSAGTLLLSGTNTFTGGVSVNAGTLRVTEATALSVYNSVSVASGAAFHFADGYGGTLGIDSLTLASGSSIGAEVGGGGIVVNSAASATGTINVDVFGIAGYSYTSGVYDLVTAAGGGLDAASYAIGSFYNITNFTVNSVGVDTDSVFVNITATSELTAAYWKGGYSGGANVWAISNGTTQSNWTTDAAGLNGTGIVPGSSTDVFFSASGATNQAVMVLGAKMSIGSLTITDSTPSILVDDPGSMLTLNKAAAITIGSTAGAVTLNTQVALNDTAPVINVANSGGLTIDGLLSGNAFTKTGAGTLTLAGAAANTMASTVFVNEGTLVLQKADGVAAIAEDLVIGDGSGTDTVRIVGSDQLSAITQVTLNSSGVLDLYAGTESFNMLQGTGLVTNSGPTQAVMTVGTANASGAFSGVIQDGTSTVDLIKSGTGTFTLNGSAANTFTGDTVVNVGTLALAKADHVLALGSAKVRIASTAVANSVLRLDADEQLRSDVAIVTYALGGRNAQLNLNGHTQTIGFLDMETTTNGGTTVATGAGGTLIVNGDITLRNNRNAVGNSPRHLLITGSGTVSTAAPNSGTLDLGGGTRTITASHIYAQPDSDALIETVITNGGIIKEGNSTLYLSGDNTYQGTTTVNSAALLVTGSHTGGGTYTVASGATLGGSGQIALATNASFDISGTVDVGPTLEATTAGRLDFTAAGTGAVTFENGSALHLSLISGAGAGDQSGNAGAADILGISGNLTIGTGVTLTVANPNTLTGWAVGDRWRLFDWTHVGTITGTFDVALPDLTSSGFSWDYSDLYTGGTIAVIVPEPGRFLLLGLGSLLLLLRRRRR